MKMTTKTKTEVNGNVYLTHESGAVHQYSGARFRKLVAAVWANNAGSILTDLVGNGYESFLGADAEQWPIDSLPDYILAR
jgi:hypothetical protein